MTDDDASSDVDVASGAIVSNSVGLAELLRIDPDVGMNTAISCAVDATNDVEHANVALVLLGPTGMFAHPLIAAPPFSNVTVPESVVLLVPALTVAINVTL